MNTGQIKLVRNIRTGENRGNTRIWIESLALETGGFDVGDCVQISIVNDAVVVLKDDAAEHTVSKRKRPNWEKERPLLDLCNQDISRVFRARERVDILVSQGTLVIRHERSFDLFVVEKPLLQGDSFQKLRLLSAPAGAGIASAALVDTGFFESVGASEIWDMAAETYLHNFPDGSFYWGDIRNQNPAYVPSANVCWLSPPCLTYSTLGELSAGITEGLAGHFARLVWGSGASTVIIEEVPGYFSSRSYQHLKMLLAPLFPYWFEAVIDAHDLGSVPGRVRGYTVCSRDPIEFTWPAAPAIPEHRRKTVGQVIGKDWEKHDWRPVEGTVMEGLLKKNGNNNFTAENNRVLVSLNDTRISAIVSNYRRIQVTSSYLQHPEKPELWRPFSSQELSSLLSVPEWFEFPDTISETQRASLLGQSVDCQVVKAIGIEVAMAMMGQKIRAMFGQQYGTVCDKNGQYSLFV